MNNCASIAGTASRLCTILQRLWYPTRHTPFPAETAGTHSSTLPPGLPVLTDPAAQTGSPRRVPHSLPAAAAASKSESFSALGPGWPPGPLRSPAASWSGPKSRKEPEPGPDITLSLGLLGAGLFPTDLPLVCACHLRPSSSLRAQSLLTSLGPVPLAGVFIRLCRDTEGKGRNRV